MSMEIKAEWNEDGVYEVCARFIHTEKDIAIKVIDDIFWIVNPNKEPRPIDAPEL